MKEKINQIATIAILIIFILSSIIPIGNNKYLMISGYVLAVIYVVNRLMQKKVINIIQNKLDLCIAILVVSTTVPMLLNAYISLNGTVEVILQYVYVFCIYILTREIIKREDKSWRLLINLLVTSLVIIIIVGVDNITGNILKIGDFANGENRLVSVFGYPNVLAIYIVSILFLNINEYLKHIKKEIKAIYKTITYIFMVGILLTYSKGAILIFAIMIPIYLWCIKNKGNRIEILQNLVVSAVIAGLYIIVFEKLINKENYILIWITLAITILVNYLINLILDKRNNKIICMFLFITIVFSIVYASITINLYDEYIAFNEEVEDNYEAKIINQIEGNQNYKFEFDIESKAPFDAENTFTIKLIERDIKNQELSSTEIKFGTISGKKQIELKTKEKTVEIKIEFKTEYSYATKKLIIKKLMINEKETPLNYKYLPTKLIEKIQNIKINYKTSQERIEMMKDATKLSRENTLIGQGGNAWKSRYREVQSYSYVSEKLHCYPAKVFLEFGVMGILSFVSIVLIIIKRLIISVKNNELENINIIFAILVIVFHSFIDFDMEYIHILIYVFMLLGIISKQIKKTENKFMIISNILLIIVAISAIYFNINEESYYKYTAINEAVKELNGLTINSKEYKQGKRNLALQYENLLKYERYGHVNIYTTIIEIYIDIDDVEKVEYYYEKLKENYANEITDIDYIKNKVEKYKKKYLLGVKVINESTINIDEAELKEISLDDTTGMLIYHTHGTESYKSEKDYETYEYYKSIDENYNVIAIGNTLTELLNKKGIYAIHNTTYNNYPSKYDTYAKSRKVVQNILAENDKINKIIDIHRDSGGEIEHEATTLNIDGNKVAQLRFVIGIDLEDEQWKYDLKWAIDIQKKANLKYPGLFLPILIRHTNYNQDLCKYSVLIEVGDNCNYITEAQNSMKYLSEFITK